MTAMLKGGVSFEERYRPVYFGRPSDLSKGMGCVVIDLDGTMLDNRHRQHFMEGENKQWGPFFDAMDKDVPFDEIKLISRLVMDHTDLDVILTTGRPSRYSDKTLNNLAEHSVKYTGLLMRKDGDPRPDAQVKLRMLQDIYALGCTIKFAIEDRPEVVAMWRANGVPCLQPDASVWMQTQRNTLTRTLENLEYHAQSVRDAGAQLVLLRLAREAKQHAAKHDNEMRELRDELERLHALYMGDR